MWRVMLMKFLSRPACLVLAGLLSCAATTPVFSAPGDLVPATAAAPALEIETLQGDHFSLEAERGKWVVINYWATWCGPCIKEMPALSEFSASRDDVVVIGLDYESPSRERIEAFLGKHPVHYAIALVDPVDPPAGLAEPDVLPTTFVVAPDGELARTFVGPLDMKKLAALVETGGDAP